MYARHDKLAIGVDLGSTNIRAAVVTANGKILSQKHSATPAEEGRLAPPNSLIDAIFTGGKVANIIIKDWYR